MKYYIIAGEASGDLHGANLIKQIKLQDPAAAIRCWGGDKMEAAGAKVVKHIRELAFMGFWEVFKNLRTILKNIEFCKQDILAFKPDVVVMIDYPGFNFRLFKFLKEHSLKNVYYISPQIWAWKKNRVYKIKEYVDRMLVIFPFEKEFYNKHGVEAEFVGHPLLDEIEQQKSTLQKLQRDKPIIALLPGSRKQEISHLLPEYLKAIKHLGNDYHYIVSGMSVNGKEFYAELMKGYDVEIVYDQTYNMLNSAYAGIVTSGTATLETALFNVPQVVCYKGSAASFFIARMIVDIPYISIVNWIAGEKVINELVQEQLTPENLKTEVAQLLEPANREKILAAYASVRDKLGNTGASKNAAEIVVQAAKK
jgi:lipid-A-disaccharide synthase